MPHEYHRIPGTGPVWFPDADAGALFDPDADADADAGADDAGPVSLGVAVSRDAYFRALGVAVRDSGADSLAVAHRAGYLDCVRLQRRALRGGSLRRRARSAVHRARALALAPGRDPRRATASASVML